MRLVGTWGNPNWSHQLHPPHLISSTPPMNYGLLVACIDANTWWSAHEPLLTCLQMLLLRSLTVVLSHTTPASSLWSGSQFPSPHPTCRQMVNDDSNPMQLTLSIHIIPLPIKNRQNRHMLPSHYSVCATGRTTQCLLVKSLSQNSETSWLKSRCIPPCDKKTRKMAILRLEQYQWYSKWRE